MRLIKILKSYINPNTYKSLEEAVKDSLYCKKIWIYIPEGLVRADDFAKQGRLFLRLRKLRELGIQGLVSDESNFLLPEEIGKMRQLEKLVLLNLPLFEFPDWIRNLKNLRYLTIRGNDVSEIPAFIKELQNLEVLRVENCDIDTLPKELKELKKLKELGLADTKIPYFSIDYLPPNLKVLGIGGPIFRYDKQELDRVRRALPKTKVYSIMK